MQTKNYNILVIEDNKIDAHLVKKILATSESAKFVLQHVSRLAPGLELLSREEFDLVMVDLGLPDSHGLNTLIQVIHQAPEIPAIVGAPPVGAVLVVAGLLGLVLLLLAVPVEVEFRLEGIEPFTGEVGVRWLFGLVRFRVPVPGAGKPRPRPEARPEAARARARPRAGGRSRRVLAALRQAAFAGGPSASPGTSSAPSTCAGVASSCGSAWAIPRTPAACGPAWGRSARRPSCATRPAGSSRSSWSRCSSSRPTAGCCSSRCAS